MDWQVTFRDGDGNLRETTLCAGSRDSAFAELKRRGIVNVLRIVPETGGRGSRRSTGRLPKWGARCAVTGMLLVALGALFLWNGGGTGKETPPAKPPKAVRAESAPVARPAAAHRAGPAAAVSGLRADPRVPRPLEAPLAWTPPPVPSGLDGQARDVWLRKMRYEKRKSADARLKNFLDNHKTEEPALYRTGTEQLLDWVFFTKVGDIPPPPLAPIPPAELSRIGEILDTVNEPGEADDDTAAERKQIVDSAKAVLKEYLAEGGTVQDFLEHYRDELVLANQKRDAAYVAIQEALRTGDPVQTLKFVEEVNRLLEAEGINPVELTDDQKEELADRKSVV